MSIDTAAVGGSTPCPRDLGGERGIRYECRWWEGSVSCCFRFYKTGGRGTWEQVGIESGEGDDKREGHSLDEEGRW